MLKLTLIEDDEVIVYLTKKIIKESGNSEILNVLSNGKKALEYFEENAKNLELLPDIIFLDISMPVIDGWQFLEEFKVIKDKIAKPISIYITTSSISHVDIEKAKQNCLVKDFIIKPISLENFNKIIVDLI
jgi:CheY-like chemotaxis protein